MKEIDSEESVRFKRQFRRALIVFAIVEFSVITMVVLYVVQTGKL